MTIRTRIVKTSRPTYLLVLLLCLALCATACEPSAGSEEHILECSKHEDCPKTGRCQPGTQYPGCVASSDADCAKTDVCKRFGRCATAKVQKAEEVGCVTDNVTLPSYEADGLLGNDACRAIGFSLGCSYDNSKCNCSEGACWDAGQWEETDPIHICAATSRKHCTASTVCKKFGMCSVSDLGCRQKTDADCALSELCKKNGKCSIVTRSYNKYPHCGVKSDKDCVNSEDCEKKSECFYDPKYVACRSKEEMETDVKRDKDAAKSKKLLEDLKAKGIDVEAMMQPKTARRAKYLDATTCTGCKKACLASHNAAEQKETDDAFDRGDAGVLDLFAETLYLEYDSLAACDKKCAHLCK